ncbi:hypothetical protein [Methylobacter sp. BlB1]|jgi:hypothetical protein|uniref:hypothetical protein n=1 Tax=Methylobacter sp. BlB1 TaxID=2785914 RepID=UPI001893A3E9|nr:hypothetical protein [Methylobacter sp. BlB1]MBF6649152.1 hypothetical protein [Methylobacter sp. BlB1]
MKKYPPAPKIRTLMVINAAAKTAEQMGKTGRFEDDLTRAWLNWLHSDSNMPNGYQLAKFLEENMGYDIDVNMVNGLDKMKDHVESELSKSRKKWLEENNIEPPFPVSTRLNLGVIESISIHEAGCYEVIPYGQRKNASRLIIKFEDAILE